MILLFVLMGTALAISSFLARGGTREAEKFGEQTSRDLHLLTHRHDED